MKKVALILISFALLGGCSALRYTQGAQVPVIGISAAGVGQSRVGQDYIDAVCAAGGIPVIIPVMTDSLAIAAILDKVDGVLMIGGEDINPSFYAEEAIPQMGEINARRDTFDLMLARMTVRERKPLLGVCRGLQAINVAFGGSLWQDIPSQIQASQIRHKVDDESMPVHEIDIKDGSRLAALTAAGSTTVNTYHHQAAKDVAPGFVVSAVAPDGVIEAIEQISEERRILAVQFHPEKMFAAGDVRFLPVFVWLVEESRK